MKFSHVGKPGIWLVIIASWGVMIFNSCSSAPHGGARDAAGEHAPRHLRSVASSQDASTIIPRDLREAVQSFRALVASSSFNSKTCAQDLDSIDDDLAHTSPSRFDLEKLKTEAQDVVQELWLSRVELHKRYIKMTEEGAVSRECVDSVRRAFVATRFLEEFVGEWALSPGPVPANYKSSVWSGSFPAIVQAPDVPSVELRSGDLLLSRGDAFISAAIARIGDIEGQFSHLAMVYIDENTGKKYTIEAHIEVGVVAAPFEKYLADGKVRSTIFRFTGDPRVAHQAAKYMFERASKATAAGANIPYDFHFDLRDDSEVFCAEVAALGYRYATRGQVELPRYQSTISAKHREFLDDIGMSGNSTFAPMDLEVDPRFALVGEWRDLARTQQSHRKDEVLTAMYAWMQEYHYVLDKSAWTKLKGTILWELRKWPIFSELLKNKFPTNMMPRTIEASTAISDTAEILFNDLTERDEDQHRRTGLWLTPAQMLETLEQLRIEDFSRWEKWESWQSRSMVSSDPQDPEPDKPRFHEIFHPMAMAMDGG
jgi:hypothetical protein